MADADGAADDVADTPTSVDDGAGDGGRGGSGDAPTADGGGVDPIADRSDAADASADGDEEADGDEDRDAPEDDGAPDDADDADGAEDALDADVDADASDDDGVHAEIDDEIDDEAEPPVIGCLRCGARVALGSRYCPSCGVPLPRSGEHAATALSRTRRNAPWPVRILVPLIVLGIVGLILSQTVLYDADAAYRSDLRDGLERTLDANRALTAELDRITNATEDVSEATAAARRAIDDLEEASDDVSALDVPTDDVATHRLVLDAIDVDLAYLRSVEAVLADPTSSELDRLGSRSARAVAALRDVRAVADGTDAIGGTRELGQWVRAQRRGRASSGDGAAKRADVGVFLGATIKIIDDGRPVQRDAMRAFALTRAARDGVKGFDEARGAAPRDRAAALVEARGLFDRIAGRRDALAGDARGLDARDDNERALADKLAALQTAAAATARGLAECIGDGTPTDPAGLAGRCLTAAKPASEAEDAARSSFRQGIDPARRAAGLRPLDAAF